MAVVLLHEEQSGGAASLRHRMHPLGIEAQKLGNTVARAELRRRGT
jgi:hypothetical protein